MMTIELDREEFLELYFFFEKLNDFFHDDQNFNEEQIKGFAESNYPFIKELYYKKLWDKLPKEDQEKLINR